MILKHFIKKISSKEGFRNKRSDQGSMICNQICPAAAVFPGIFPRTRGKKSGMNSDCIRLPGEENIAGAATEHLQPATTDSQHLAVFSQYFHGTMLLCECPMSECNVMSKKTNLQSHTYVDCFWHVLSTFYWPDLEMKLWFWAPS